MPPQICLIAAIANNGIIGHNNQLPWHLPADLRHFKALTMGCPVIMGRKTFASLPRALVGRRMIVVSRTLTPSSLPKINPEQRMSIEIADSLPSAITLSQSPTPEPTNTPINPSRVFIIGGQAMYESALPLASRLYITHIDQAFNGEVRFPLWPIDKDTWHEISRESHIDDSGINARKPLPYHFVVYQKTA